jgi:PEP-CTERM motif
LRGLTIVYDSNADTYSLELPTGGWQLAPLDAPTYTYDAHTGALLPRSSACVGVACESSGVILRGDANSATIGYFTGQGIPIGTTAEPGIGGFIDAIGLSGLFNLPIFGGSNSGGGPIDVPEPSMLLLFGGGAAMVIRRRKKAAAA